MGFLSSEYNKDLFVDVRLRGWDYKNYTFPHTAPPTPWIYSVPSSAIYTIAANARPDNKLMADVESPMKAPEWDPEHDMAHERDFESEDLDFQPEDFKMQVAPNHFGISDLAKNIYSESSALQKEGTSRTMGSCWLGFLPLFLYRTPSFFPHH